MNPTKQDYDNLKVEFDSLKRKIDELNNPATLSEQFLNALVKKGFMRKSLELVYTNSSGLEFTTVFADYENKTTALSGFDKSYYIKFTAETSDVCTASTHGLSDGDQVYLLSTGTFPSPLSPTAPYYIRDATTNTFKLTTTPGGAAVNITTSGSGAHYMQPQ